ncbi:MAG: hypothetical protein F6K10_39340 [Moorea sp. SIO2B7]|nr:hypothetical protein [Moorena sp. SIO2B7]
MIILVIFATKIIKIIGDKLLLYYLDFDLESKKIFSTIMSYSVATLGIIAVLQATGFEITSGYLL